MTDFALYCLQAVQVVKSSSATTVIDSAESTSSAAMATATAKPQSKKPDSSVKQSDGAATSDKKDGKVPVEDVTSAEDHTGNSPPLSIASSDDICEYNLFSDEDTESDASLGE